MFVWVLNAIVLLTEQFPTEETYFRETFPTKIKIKCIKYESYNIFSIYF